MPVGYVSWGVVTPVYTLSLINYHIVRIKHYTQAQRRMLSLSHSVTFFSFHFCLFPCFFFKLDYIKLCLLLTVNFEFDVVAELDRNLHLILITLFD